MNRSIRRLGLCAATVLVATAATLAQRVLR
jgi:hypothetical protein